MGILEIQIDKRDKKEFRKFCKETGLDINTAIYMYIKYVIRNQKLPFQMAVKDPFYSEKNLEVLRTSIQQLEAGHQK